MTKERRKDGQDRELYKRSFVFKILGGEWLRLSSAWYACGMRLLWDNLVWVDPGTFHSLEPRETESSQCMIYDTPVTTENIIKAVQKFTHIY